MTKAPRARILAVILLLFFAAAVAVEALVFDVPSGSSKCLTEELRGGAPSHASYRVAEATSTSAAASSVSVRVTGPRGEELHRKEGVERGEFRFEAAEGGRHTACFWTPHYERGAVVSVDLQWTTGGGGGRAHGGVFMPAATAATKGRIDSIVGELKKLEDSARMIHEEMISLRESEGEMQRLNEETTLRMHGFTLLSLVICAGVAGFQLWHLKTFFEKRRILRT